MVHYVILVVCPIGSSSDVFCKKHLRRLSWWANPFLVAKQGEAQTGFLFSRGDKGQAFYLVHLFFAEVIDLTGMQCRWRQGEMDGGGQQSLDVNSDCPHCSQQASSKQRLGARAWSLGRFSMQLWNWTRRATTIYTKHELQLTRRSSHSTSFCKQHRRIRPASDPRPDAQANYSNGPTLFKTFSKTCLT